MYMYMHDLRLGEVSLQHSSSSHHIFISVVSTAGVTSCYVKLPPSAYSTYIIIGSSTTNPKLRGNHPSAAQVVTQQKAEYVNAVLGVVPLAWPYIPHQHCAVVGVQAP